MSSAEIFTQHAKGKSYKGSKTCTCRFSSHLLTALLLTLAIFGGFDGSTCEARRCYAGMPSCFPTQSDAMRLDAKMDGKIVVPEAALNYTHYNTQWNLRTKT